MKDFFLIVLVVTLATETCFSSEPSFSQEVWRNESVRFIKEVGDKPTADEMLKLAAYAAIKYPGIEVSELQAEVSALASRKLTSISNHAVFFEDHLKSLRSTHHENPGKIDYNSERTRLFRSLGQMESAQVVELLISLLDDNIDYKELEPGSEIFSNCTLAESTLCGMIDAPPVPNTRFGPGTYKRDLLAWKKWGEQVSDGVRTFQFKGSSQIYNLSGPVEIPAKVRERRTVSAPEEAYTSTRPKSSKVSWTPLAVAVLMLFGSGWWCLRNPTRK
ncbi:hypothetical protein [Haloferula sp.]|uniref:hypothetical protein n=1 Tax=Haloferula sp. TaxID=2497595 RepID=UPI003C780C28